MNPLVYILIPVYNEPAESLDVLLQEVHSTGHEIVLIDDGSRTDYRPLIRNIPLHYLRHLYNLGQGAALQTGMEYARRKGVAYVVHFDGDGQHRVADISRLLHPLFMGEADLTLGSRFLSPEGSTQVPKIRRLWLKAAAVFNGLLTGIWLSDAHCGLRALNAQALDALQLQENRMAHATELLWQIKAAELRWREIPVIIQYSEGGRRQSLWQAVPLAVRLVGRYLFP